MKIAVLTDEGKHALFHELIGSLHIPGREPKCILYETYDDFIQMLPDSDSDITLIALSGASGMESARAAKILRPELPLIWLSDDKGFGPESYRVGCSYFSAAPITKTLLQSAIARCQQD